MKDLIQNRAETAQKMARLMGGTPLPARLKMEKLERVKFTGGLGTSPRNIILMNNDEGSEQGASFLQRWAAILLRR